MSARSHRSPLLQRLTALLGVALVLALNVLAVRPDLHAALHAAESAADSAHHGGGCSHSHKKAAPATPVAPVTSDDHDCVVSAFAHGHADFGVAPLALPAVLLSQIATLSAHAALEPRAPAFLLPPGCGPPAV